jgi:hypothetical protein
MIIPKDDYNNFFLYGYTAFGLWPFFNFSIVYTVDRTAYTGDQPAARPLSTQNNTNTE